MALKNYVAELGGRLKGAVASGPVEIALSLMAWVAYVWGVQADRDPVWDITVRVTFIAGIALPIVFAASFSHKRGGIGFGVRSLITAAAIVVAVVGSFCVDWDTSFSPVQVTASVIASLAAMTAIPRQFKMPYAEYHRFLMTFAARFSTTFLVCLVLASGVSLALGALDVILGVSFSADAYLNVYGLAMIVVFPALIVGDIPELVEDVAKEYPNESSTGLRAIRFVFIPLVFIYLVLACLYFVTRLAAGEHETDILVVVVLGASILAWIGQDIYAMKIATKADFFARFLRGFAWALVPLVVVTFLLATFEAPRDYFDEPLYFAQIALLVALACFGATVVQFLKGGGPSLAGPRLALVIGSLVAAWGGPLSFASIQFSRNVERTVDAAQRAGVLGEDGTCMNGAEFEAHAEALRDRSYEDDQANALRELSGVRWQYSSDSHQRELAERMGCELSLVQAMVAFEPYGDMGVQLPEYNWHTVMASEGAARLANLPAGDFVQFRAYPPGQETYEGSIQVGQGTLKSRIDAETYELFFLLDGKEIHRQSLKGVFDALDQNYKTKLAPFLEGGAVDVPSYELAIGKEHDRSESEGVVVVIESVTLQLSAIEGKNPVPSIVVGHVVFPRSLNVFGDAAEEAAPAQNEEPTQDAPVEE